MCLRKLVIAGLLQFLVFSHAVHANQSSVAGFQLADYCPPGFDHETDNRCVLNSVYTRYSSLKNAGVGGLKTGLPPYRDGFSPQQIDLGRFLFFDPVLSANGKVSCASCHHPDQGFSDGKAQSVGINGQVMTRSAPSLWNTGLLNRFFWDSRASSLEQQMKESLYSPVEMGNSPEQLITTLNRIPVYASLFQEAFPDEFLHSDTITLEQVYTAIAAFESSLISLNSRYDLYAQGMHDALSENEIAGFNVFRSFVARCAECHTPPLFTNQQIAVLGTPEPEGKPLDIGAAGPTGKPSLRGGFKVPSLRNIELTAPYMHSGRFTTLRDTVSFYSKGRGHAIPEGEYLYLHWHIWEPDLTEDEIDRIVDFLRALTDVGFTPVVPEQVPSGLTVQ